jgi:hypothetical protein
MRRRLALFFLVAACSADDPIDKDKRPDAAPAADLPPPELEPVVERTPRTAVEVKGETEGSRVVATGSPGGTVVTVVLPGGTFCQETPIAAEGTTTLRFFAMAGDGRLSRGVPVEVAHDATAPDPGPACGDPVPSCGDAEECGADGVDDDCNGWADRCDLACSDCQEDVYEPNDFPVNVPTVAAGTYDMELCPCRDDWFAFQVNTGDRIHAVIDFVHADIDIDARLYLSGPEGYGIVEPPVASSTGTGDQEVIDHTAAMAGTYFLRVYPFRDEDDPAGAYSIALD